MIGPAPKTPHLDKAKELSKSADSEETRDLWSAIQELRELAQWHAQAEAEKAAGRLNRGMG